MDDKGNIIIYRSDDGSVKLDVRLEEETVWLTQDQIGQLFGKSRSTITEHISNIFKEGELDGKVVCWEFRHTTPHGVIVGKTQELQVRSYNLDVIISVGYRVNPFKEHVSVNGLHSVYMNTSLAEYRKYQVKTLSPVEHD